MRITKKSPFSGKENTMDLNITNAQLLRWQRGELIQRVFPDLSANEREFLMTGIMPEEWDMSFKDE